MATSVESFANMMDKFGDMAHPILLTDQKTGGILLATLTTLKNK
jgi:hypothetical protein